MVMALSASYNGRMDTWWGRLVYWVVHGICVSAVNVTVRLLGGWRAEGLENVPRQGGLLIAPNHLSHVDPPLIGMMVRRPVWFVATDELMDVRVFGRLSRILRSIPIHQDSPDRLALRRLRRLLEAGECVVLFPEGHESLDGKMRPLQGGAVLLALWSHVPIVPVGIEGTSAMMAPRSYRLRKSRRPAVVRFGEPISYEELTGGLTGREALDHGMALLAERIRVLAGQAPEAGGRTYAGNEGISLSSKEE